jgi:serine/threonine-protein kinase
MGQVWMGSIRATGEAVAVKVLNPEYGSDPEVVSRFLQERSILMGLHSPHLVGVRDLVAEGETLAIVMDLVQGGDLRRYLGASGPTLAPAFAAGLTAQVLTGLAAVHAAGIVHRDLKPENVLLDRGGDEDLPICRLSDFGIARLTAGPGLTKTTGLIGTPEYMPPEVAGEENPGPGADLYAAGIMLYELVAGRTPFSGGAAVAVLRRHMDEAPARPDGVPDPLWELIAELLAKRPELRPSAAESAQRLVAMIPALLAVATPGEGAEGPDPNVTMLPGYRPSRPAGEAVSTGRLRVPLPLAADRPRGNEQVTVLPGRAPSGPRQPVMVPPAFRPPATAPAAGSHRTMLIAGAVIAALFLVGALGAGLLLRPGPSSGGSASSTQSTSALPVSGQLDGGRNDTSFSEPAVVPPFVAKTQGLSFTPMNDPAIAKDGHGSYLQVISTVKDGTLERAVNATLSPDRRYTVSLLLRSNTAAKILGRIGLVSTGGGPALQSAQTPFCVRQGWIQRTVSVNPSKGDTALVFYLYIVNPKLALDITQVEYTFSSGPPAAAVPNPPC